MLLPAKKQPQSSVAPRITRAHFPTRQPSRPAAYCTVSQERVRPACVVLALIFFFFRADATQSNSLSPAGNKTPLRHRLGSHALGAAASSPSYPGPVRYFRHRSRRVWTEAFLFWDRVLLSNGSASAADPIPPLASKTYMGCTQSTHAIDTTVTSPRAPVQIPDSPVLPLAATRTTRRSHNKSVPPSSSSGHRDVFSIFGEHGMVLEASHTVESSQASPTFASHRICGSPCSASGSVFSTATTASDTERTNAIRGPIEQHIPELSISYGVFSDKGMRKINEDRRACVSQVVGDEMVAFFGVYDGHGGTKVAEHLSKNLHTQVFDRLEKTKDMVSAIEDAFAATDNEVFDMQMESGSTALSCMIRGRNAIVACVGDSQAVLSTNGKARGLSVIHSPDADEEKRRILAAKGVVVKGRIFGLLSVSRAFGDNDFKTSRGEYKHKFNGDLVTAVPDVVEFKLEQEDEFLVLGCDGLFEVMDPQHVVDFVRAKLALHGEVQHACEELVSYAISIGSTDNVTAVVICLNQPVLATHQPRAEENLTAQQ